MKNSYLSLSKSSLYLYFASVLLTQASIKVTFLNVFFLILKKLTSNLFLTRFIQDVQPLSDELLVKSHAKDEIIFVFRKLRKIISMICIKTLKTRIYSRNFGCLSLILISFINRLVQIDVNALAQQVV